MRDGVSKLDEQLFVANDPISDDDVEQDDNILTQLLQYHPNAASKPKKKKFVRREFIHTPGTKEG